MPNINLIAERRAEKKRLERNTRRLFFGLAAEAGVLVVLSSLAVTVQYGLRGDLSAADTKLAKIRPALDRIDEVEKGTKALLPKLDTLRTAREDTQRWRALLQVVSQSIPANAWLSSLTSTTPEGSETVITLSGTAGSQSLVGETMTRLGAFPVFDQVDLRFTRMASGADESGPRIAFEIGARLRPTRSSAEAAAAGKEGKAGGGSARAARQEGSNSDVKPSA